MRDQDARNVRRKPHCSGEKRLRYVSAVTEARLNPGGGLDVWVGVVVADRGRVVKANVRDSNVVGNELLFKTTAKEREKSVSVRI